MEITNLFYTPNRSDWRAWLQQHYQSQKEIWLVSYSKASSRPNLPYNDAVEEALCFGWIDSINKKLDSERRAQRFSPRLAKSGYSQPNIERLRWLAERGLVMPEILAGLGDVLSADYIFPPDILDALQSDPRAWEHFQRFSGPYQRIRVAFVDGARKRPDEFQKRLGHLLAMTQKGKQFGYGIEKYF